MPCTLCLNPLLNLLYPQTFKKPSFAHFGGLHPKTSTNTQTSIHWISLPHILFFSPQIIDLTISVGQCLTACTCLLSLLVCTPPAASGHWTSKTTRSAHKQLSTSKRRLSTPCLLACIWALYRSGKRPVSGHSRALLIHRCCSQPRIQTCLWQCPIIIPPSCEWFALVLPGILVCRPPGLYPQTRHAVNQILAAGREAAAFLLHHHMPQLPLQRNVYAVYIYHLV